MKDIKIMDFKEWVEKNYRYDLLGDLAILSRVDLTTFNSKTREDSFKIKERLLNANRSNLDKESVKKYAYCLHYLNNFLGSNPMNFDNLLELVNNKEVITVERLRSL